MNNGIDSTRTHSPDEVVMLIRSHKALFCGAKERISLSHCKSFCSQLSKPVTRYVESTIAIPDIKNNASANHAEITRYFQSFQDRYESYGDRSVSEKFAHEFDVLHRSAEIVREHFDRIFAGGLDLVLEDEKSLDILVLAIKSIIIRLDLLSQQHRQAQLQAELDWQQQQQEDCEPLGQTSEDEPESSASITAAATVEDGCHRSETVADIGGTHELRELRPLEPHQDEEGGDINLINDDYRNNIQKAVNNLCSQITSGNESHAIGRLRELIVLLDGGQIALVGTEHRERLDLMGHPAAPRVCWQLLRDAVITQAETQFADNLETALAFAGLLAALLGRFPAEMPVLLGALYARYLLALQPGIECQCQGASGDTNVTGTEVDPGTNQQRLRGIARLMGAVLVARTPTGFSRHAQLSTRQLWGLLAALASSGEPLRCPHRAAEACLALLEVGSPALLGTYGNQATKLLIALQAWFQQHRCGGSGSLSQRAVLLKINDVLN